MYPVWITLREPSLNAKNIKSGARGSYKQSDTKTTKKRWYAAWIPAKERSVGSFESANIVKHSRTKNFKFSEPSQTGSILSVFDTSLFYSIFVTAYTDPRKQRSDMVDVKQDGYVDI